jgi:quercetin 2,3-dioxygenase
VITGKVDDTHGPVSGIAANPTYMDVSIPPHTTFTQTVDNGSTAFAYLFQGKAKFTGGEGAEKILIQSPKLVVWGNGDFIDVTTEEDPARLLLVSGKPLHEPIARYGPFVMNTREEIEQALRDLRQGTFV